MGRIIQTIWGHLGHFFDSSCIYKGNSKLCGILDMTQIFNRSHVLMVASYLLNKGSYLKCWHALGVLIQNTFHTQCFPLRKLFRSYVQHENIWGYTPPPPPCNLKEYTRVNVVIECTKTLILALGVILTLQNII